QGKITRSADVGLKFRTSAFNVHLSRTRKARFHFAGCFNVDIHTTRSTHPQIYVVCAYRTVRTQTAGAALTESVARRHVHVGRDFPRIPRSEVFFGDDVQPSALDFCLDVRQNFRVAFQYHALCTALSYGYRSRHAEIETCKPGYLPCFFLLCRSYPRYRQYGGEE